MAAESSRSGSSADSYIGSLISLTSKSEMRYEGILYNINTDESSIGLRNVRSFGTEGRKKDGPQVPPSDKVYEYILFRGSDIKDLQVKSSPPVQSAAPINNDPAIIQSHYPRPASTSSSLVPPVTGSVTDLNSHTAQLGLPGSNFQGGLPLYQPGGTLGSWGPTPPPPSANGSGLAMPMYWQGFYGPPNGIPQLHQQSLLRPPPGLSMPPSLQQPMQYPGFNASLPAGASNLPGSNLPEYPSLVPPATSSLNLGTSSLPSSTFPSPLPPAPSIGLAPETLPSLIQNKDNVPNLPTSTLTANLSALSLNTSGQNTSAVAPPTSNIPNEISGPTFSYQNISLAIPSTVGTSSSSRTEAPTQAPAPTPSLVTPGQLLQSGPVAVSSSESSQTGHKDVEVVQVSSSSTAKPSAPVATESQPPILPLPQPSRVGQKHNGAPFHSRHGYRGRERGRGGSRPLTKFTEDFDFTAMNEKFKKDEVWDHLGKTNKSQKDGDENGSDEGEDDYDYQHEDSVDVPKIDVKPVYNKDDFFDSLSSNALDRESNHARPRFSEQMKLDTETFGEFSRYRGGRGGGRGPGRGGRFRGNYYGRGYGYVGRGRGRGVSYQS